MNTIQLKLTDQEQQVINYLNGKAFVYWEELAQFAKEPQNVKLKTIQKLVSGIKLKFNRTNIPCPFDCMFTSKPADNSSSPTTTHNFPAASAPKGGPLPILPSSTPSQLSQIRVTLGGNRVPVTDVRPDAHIDFQLLPNRRAVKTRNSVQELGENEWEVFTHLHKNAGRPVDIEEFRNIIWKNFGSKTPHNWAESFARRLTNLRKNIPELKLQGRLMTVTSTGQSTAYMLK